MINVFKVSCVEFDIFTPYSEGKKDKAIPKHAIANGISNDVTSKLLRSVLSLNKSLMKFLSEDE